MLLNQLKRIWLQKVDKPSKTCLFTRIVRLREAEANEALQQQMSQRALVVSGSRSPTAELERALRDQLNYSHTLDEDIMEQVSTKRRDRSAAAAGVHTMRVYRTISCN